MNQFQKLSVQAAMLADKMLDDQDGAEVCIVLTVAAEIARRTVTGKNSTQRQLLDEAIAQHMGASAAAFEAMDMEELPS